VALAVTGARLRSISGGVVIDAADDQVLNSPHDTQDAGIVKQTEAPRSARTIPARDAFPGAGEHPLGLRFP
jgi:hypothetical protein